MNTTPSFKSYPEGGPPWATASNRKRGKILWFFASWGLILLGLVSSVAHFLRPSVNSPNDLSVLKGKIATYSFTDDHHGFHNYLIHLDNYAADFRIPAEFRGVFFLDRFQSTIKQGDPISVSVPKQSLAKVNSYGEMVLIFEIHSGTGAYLSEADTIPAYNSPFDYILSSFMILTGVALAVARKRFAT